MGRKPIILIILFLILLTCGCTEFDAKHKAFMAEEVDKTLKDTEIYSYKSSDYDFVSTRVSGDGRYTYNISFEMDERFSSLDKDRILSLSVEMKHKLDRKPVNCGKKMICDFDNIVLIEGDNVYEISFNLPDEVSINGESYNGVKHEYVFIPSSKDEETYVDGKNGSDWLSMTDNQKFHAVSNALYRLSTNGYTIEETEQFYIDALDNYYDGASGKNKSISKTLAEIGLLSGTIYK